jgi:ATP synthase protein I
MRHPVAASQLVTPNGSLIYFLGSKPWPVVDSVAPCAKPSRNHRVLNSLSVGRRLALRLFAWQVAVAALVGLAFLGLGWRDALAAAVSALLVALGNALMAARTFSGVGAGGAMLGRLIAGMILKWVVIVGGLLLVLVHWKLPPLAALAGLAAAFAVNLLAFRFKG